MCRNTSSWDRTRPLSSTAIWRRSGRCRRHDGSADDWLQELPGSALSHTLTSPGSIRTAHHFDARTAFPSRLRAFYGGRRAAMAPALNSNRSAGPKVHERFGQIPDCTVAVDAVATTPFPAGSQRRESRMLLRIAELSRIQPIRRRPGPRQGVDGDPRREPPHRQSGADGGHAPVSQGPRP
jgi:hypothetical protein